MKTLNLNMITLVCIDCINYDSSLHAINKSCENINFGEVMFINDASPFYIKRIKTLTEYSEFVLKKLYDYILTDYCLIVQHDGYVINPKAWNDEFMDYDYIGAPWWRFDHNNVGNVGNGGFSLRSRKLLKACKEYNFSRYYPEDDVLCRTYRQEFEEMGFKWATESLAAKFSWEPNIKYPYYNNQFGFHCNNYTPEVK